MPGYVIHLAAANVHLRVHGDTLDREAFLAGVIEPDRILPKKESHYSDSDTAHPGLDRFADSHDPRDSFQRGYFFHLLTDYLFYNKFLEGFAWRPPVYDDYDRLNGRLIEKYCVDVPDEVRDCVGFRDDELEVFDYDKVCGFIDEIGAVDLDALLRTRAYDEVVITRHGG